jgi:hypothetical protein
MSREDAAGKLRELGEDEAAESLEAEADAEGEDVVAFGPFDALFSRRELYLQRAHVFGHIGLNRENEAVLDIQPVANIPPDMSLRHSRLVVRLDRLRVASYPGGGTHHVLFDFYAEHHVSRGSQHLHFNTTCRAREGEDAAILGYPIFVGLGVGQEGIALECHTVNVRNDEDSGLLAFLDSDIFRSGLKLATTFQPAIAPLSQMALGLSAGIAKRHKNVTVQEFRLGLDFGGSATGARLAEGSYLAVQIPAAAQLVWDWANWRLDAATGQVVNSAEPTRRLPYNYIVFSITKYQE